MLERVTPIRVMIVRAALEADERDEPVYGWKIAEELGLKRPTVYGNLNRLHAEGWVTRAVEQPNPDVRRPNRLYHRLTDEGRRKGRALLALVQIEETTEGETER